MLNGLEFRSTWMPEHGAEAVFQVAGKVTFASRDHEPRDAALLLLQERLKALYGEGTFRADVDQLWLSARFSFTLAAPVPAADLPDAALSLDP